MSEHSHPRFWQAWSKLKWANKHILEAQARWEGHLGSDFYRLVLEPKTDTTHERFACHFDALPVEIALSVGDAIHNMRCALDYTIGEILGYRDMRLAFPTHQKEEQLVDAFRTESVVIDGKAKKRGSHANIEAAVPGFGKFIVEDVRPYQTGNAALWTLNKLDTRDKHRLLVAMPSPHSIKGVKMVHKRNPGIQLTSSLTFMAGNAVGIVAGNIGEFEVQDYGEISADILIQETGVIEKQPLFPTLVNISEAVCETIKAIDEFLTGIGWSPPSWRTNPTFDEAAPVTARPHDYAPACHPEVTPHELALSQVHNCLRDLTYKDIFIFAFKGGRS